MGKTSATNAVMKERTAESAAADRVGEAFDRELSRSILAARQSSHVQAPASVFKMKPTTVFPPDSK